MSTEISGIAPIHDLPDEILVEIFQMHTSGNPVCFSELGRGYYHKHHRDFLCAARWPSLMLVCRHWRNIALETPVLWQVVDVRHNTAWLRLAVERSRNAPLELYFHQRDPAIDSIPLIISQAHRLRKLLLPPLKRCDLPALQPLLQTPMLVLSELRVHFEPSRRDFTSYHHPIPIDSIDSCFPSLRSIRLQNMAVAWTLPALARMRYLNLRNCTALDTYLTFDRFLDVLEGCNELEDLRLHEFLTTIAHHVQAGFSRAVLLPRLQRLTVREPPALCRQFLSAVHLSPTIILRVFGQIDPNVDPNNAQRLFTSMLPEDLSSLSVIRTLKYASFDGELDENGMNLRTWSDPSDPFGAGSLVLVLDWEQMEVEGYTPHALAELAHLFVHAPLEEVYIFCLPRSVREPATWTLVFSALRAVHTLIIHPGRTLRPVWDGLAGRHLPLPTVDADVAHAYAPFLLPCLRTLEIEYIDWDEDAMDYVLASMRRRAMRDLPKLDSLSVVFVATVDESMQVKKEAVRMVPFYEKSMEEFAATFTWRLT